VLEELLQRLGKRIQELRKQRGWSQDKFAEICGVHRTYVGHMETAKKPGISLMSVARAAHALGVSLSELFAGLEDGGETPSAKPSPARFVDHSEVPIRVGRNAIRIEKLIDELRIERDALRQATRQLNSLSGKAKSTRTRRR
jgi:transcriptional regulator with XRE-family HTH domain